jgi:chromosome segregation ATPase
VNEHPTERIEADNGKTLSPLVERLDPAIGELSTVMGAMMTELLRRTLRGSVRQIDDELKGHVAEKVDATIAQRLPAIEQSATEVAEKAAREAATEVAVEEVQALEQRGKEVQRELAGKIEQVEQRAEQNISTRAHELTTRIEDTARHAATTTEEKARELARQIEEAEHRANAAAQAEVARQVEDLLQRSRRTTAEMKDRLQALETTAGMLGKQILDEAGDRKAEQTAFRADVDGRLKAVLQQLQQQDQARRAAEEQFRRDLTAARHEARQTIEALERRVVELEKPRGLRALWAWLFGRWKKEAGAGEPAAEATEAEATVVSREE